VALRHSTNRQGTQSKLIHAGPLIIDLAWHIVKRGDEEIKLTATEYKLLAYLAANHGRVLTHQSILTNVWGPADANHTEYLRVYMRQLRIKLETDPERPQYILTEPGIGYRFIADE
jgi:two-component system KDP operon response regulator KdpE